ncbi:MAG: CBS domain-containing protein [Dehalococcoidia bacterium]|nr:CBS domain-containing protein [Dehalococcoidia bacterium]
MSSEEYLDTIKAQLTAGRNAWRRADNLFRAFGYVRRRQTAIDLINKELAKRQLKATPALSTTIPLTSFVSFSLVPLSERVLASGDDKAPEPPKGDPNVPMDVDDVEEPPATEAGSAADKALIVGNLEASENQPEMITAQASITEAITRMELHDYSQLVVGNGPGSVKGLVSYKSIARAQLLGKAICVGDALDTTVPRVDQHAPLLEVIAHFQKHDAVLVFGVTKALRGIVTPADIAIEFSDMAGPFLLIGQIEEQLRWLVKRWLEREGIDLAAALKLETTKNGSAPQKIEDLTMGELHWILSVPANWKGIGIPYDRTTFCQEFDRIREIRNAVMHFRELPGANDQKRIEDFANVVQRAYVACVK